MQTRNKATSNFLSTFVGDTLSTPSPEVPPQKSNVNPESPNQKTDANDAKPLTSKNLLHLTF
jgi:hypothetical protein